MLCVAVMQGRPCTARWRVNILWCGH